MNAFSRVIPVNVLVVEDDAIDREGLKRSFHKANSNHSLEFVYDGLQALDRLRGQDGLAAMNRPFIILLDLNLPKMNGHDFLNNLRADPLLSDSVVVVLTTSNSEDDRQRAYHKNVAAYILKSDVGTNYSNILKFLDCYEQFVQLPMPITGAELN